MFVCWTFAGPQFSVSEFLVKHETEFFSVVNARFSLLRLKRLGVITQDVVSRINAATKNEDAQEILYKHLIHHATVDTLREYCEVATAAEGYPGMQSFGRKMVEELQQGWLSCVHTCMCVCMCVHVCVVCVAI